MSSTHKNISFDLPTRTPASTFDITDNLPPRPTLRSSVLVDMGPADTAGDGPEPRSTSVLLRSSQIFNSSELFFPIILSTRTHGDNSTSQLSAVSRHFLRPQGSLGGCFSGSAPVAGLCASSGQLYPVVGEIVPVHGEMLHPTKNHTY